MGIQGSIYNNPSGNVPDGYYCGSCGSWVTQGVLHICESNVSATPVTYIYSYSPIGEQLAEIVRRLEAIEGLLKEIHDKQG
jgi:hypothetical protein